MNADQIRSRILESSDLPQEAVDVPEWGIDGGNLFVRVLRASERDRFEQEMLNARKGDKLDLPNIRARLVSRCLVDMAGARVFEDKDIEALGQKSGAVVDRLFDACQRINKMTDADVEDLAGN